MEAFVGAPLTSARSFVTGGEVSRERSVSGNGRSVVVPTAQFKLPELPKLPKISLPGGGGKKDDNKTKTQTPKPLVVTSSGDAPTGKTAYKPTVLKSPVRVELTKEERNLAAATIRANQPTPLPKFYNPDTARAQYKVKASGQNTSAFDSRIGKKINERTNDNGTFRNMDPYTEPLLWARPGWSPTEASNGIKAAIKNVFGNANLFESDLAELEYNISCVKKTADMKEFVRALGLSNAYKSRFFEPCNNQRFVELNFKHFLGRAPHSQAEISEHIQTLVTKGYNAEINSYIDSEEYASLFGSSRLPAVNFRGGHPYNNDMNKLAVLNGPYASSDRVTTKAIINNGDISFGIGYSILKGLPEAWRGENMTREQGGPSMTFPDKFWNEDLASIIADELAWKSKWGAVPFWYKKSIVYEESIKPKLSNTPQEVREAEAALKYGSLMGKFFVGTRKSFDMAPDIVMKAPTNGIGGMVSVAMKVMEPVIPPDLQQSE